jgi:hypothetical protein
MKSKRKTGSATKRDPWGQPIRIKDTTMKLIHELHPKNATHNAKLYVLLKELKNRRGNELIPNDGKFPHLQLPEPISVKIGGGVKKRKQ